MWKAIFLASGLIVAPIGAHAAMPVQPVAPIAAAVEHDASGIVKAQYREYRHDRGRHYGWYKPRRHHDWYEPRRHRGWYGPPRRHYGWEHRQWRRHHERW